MKSSLINRRCTSATTMLLTLLSLSCERSSSHAPELARLIREARPKDAVAIGRQRFERQSVREAMHPEEGALLGRAMLALDMVEAASEVFHQQLKAYDQVSRGMVRWHSALDQAWLFHHLNKASRAVECWNIVARDPEAPLALRVEGLCGAALSLQALGQHAHALAAAGHAVSLCSDGLAAGLGHCARAVQVEVQARQRLLDTEDLSDHAFAQRSIDAPRQPASRESLAAEAAKLAAQPDVAPLLAERLSFLQGGLLSAEPGARAESIAAFIRWLRERGLAGLDASSRVEACLSMLAAQSVGAAKELIQPLAGSEREVDANPHAIDIQYCLSKIHLGDGRFSDSMRQYKRHVAQAMRLVHGTVMSRIEVPVAGLAAPSQDTTGLRLPPRYRAAYRYIIEHLHDNELSVREVAGRLGVTERALQLAFRNHLGVTPAELIRSERMKRIEGELNQATDSGGRLRVLDVANRWGISNRSTLANAFKRAQPSSVTVVTA
jgi:AraC-like DNA-binding protein